MKIFQEKDRYIYPLTKSSVVMDVGAHKGTFAAEIYRLYGCRILCYEPVKEFFDELKLRTFGMDGVECFKYGLGGKDDHVTFHIKGDMTGAYAEGPEERVEIRAIDGELRLSGLAYVNLIKINAEGGEYALIESILDHNLAKSFGSIQVQFHGCIPDARERRDRIRERLSATHELGYDAPWCWESWNRK